MDGTELKFLYCNITLSYLFFVTALSQTEKVTAVRSLLLKLPKAHYTMLTYFICLLQAIAKKSNINLMCPMNLGVCVGPSLLWPNTPCDKAPKAVPMVVELLIVKAEALFGPQISGLLGNGSPETSNALLDSGAEESDSLHSVGISLDSMELSTPRKEKLSLSRDSGLTLSEDDSNSNGGNSPAPRNILHSLSAPTCNMQQESKLVARYNINNHNVSGLPQVNQRQNIYSNKAELYSTVNDELYTTPYMGERYVHNSINIGISNGIDERNYVSKTALQRSMADIYEQSPAKYITGLEPQKPPRSNLSKTARTSKVYSMFAETQETDKSISNKNFNRAKSSDNLLESKQENIDSKRDLVSSQENIVYSNIHDLAMFTENIQRQNQYQTHAETVSNANYSRVYTGWEKKSANYTNSKSNNGNAENIYGQMAKKQGETSQTKTDGNVTPAATIFTRNDWTRQAARTKSLEVSEEVHANTEKMRNGNYEMSVTNCCRKRRFDPAHMCTKSCSVPPANRELDKHQMNPLQNSYSYVENTHTNNSEDNKKTRLRNYNTNKLNQSKSLANIILHSDSSSSDTLYQPQNSFNSRSTESPASENSFENCYTTQYIDPLYTSVYNRRRDIFHDMKSSNMFPSDIYKATPTAVKPEYNSENEQNNNKKPPHMPPPVPPRKMVYQRVLKKFQPVHVNKDDKNSRSKSVPRLYREPSNGADKKSQNNMVALDGSESDTESESYV